MGTGEGTDTSLYFGIFSYYTCLCGEKKEEEKKKKERKKNEIISGLVKNHMTNCFVKVFPFLFVCLFVC